MRVIRGTSNPHTMLLMYGACAKAQPVVIRDQEVRNVRNMAVVLDPGKSVLTAFKAREFNLAYAKREWLWYLGADKFDDSICEHAKMWAKLKQEDGTFYSNYGQYIFGWNDSDEGSPLSQFEYVIDQLKSDPNTRRASMVLLQPYHLFKENTDTVCTYAINFAIESGLLHMTVHMRSNDVIFGFTNDAFCFSQLYHLVHAVLKTKYPNLGYGDYVHFTDSMHVYKRHYGMIQKILQDDAGGYDRLRSRQPVPTAEEAIALFRSKGKEGARGEYTDWLFEA